MKELGKEVNEIMAGRFGKDTVIALATVENEVPYVRYVNAYYENGAFYIITYALSNKMKHIENNSSIAIAGEWFTAHGKGINLGYFGKEENHRIAERLKNVFSEWIDNGHNNFEDENTIILCVELTDGVLLSHGIRYEFQVSKFNLLEDETFMLTIVGGKSKHTGMYPGSEAVEAFADRLGVIRGNI